MLRPFLFVGCGGSGVKTVRLIRRRAEQRLRASGYRGPFPDAWQFIAVDVPNVEDTPSDLLAVPGVRYVGLTDSGSSYRGAEGADMALIQKAPAALDYAQWRSNPDEVHANIVAGAGQQRSVGRVVANVFSSKLRPVLLQAIKECNGGKAQLSDCATTLGIDTRIGTPALLPTVVLISSLGGGSGSGIFLDIADMLRMSAGANDAWLRNNLNAILYDPTVFDRDGTILEEGVPPNSLAAISELVAGQWSQWESPAYTGFQGALGNYAGPEYPFLVGSQNGSVAYSDPMQVYQATAEALTAWLIDPDMAASIESFTAGNWAAKGAQSSLPLHGGPTTRMPLSALGFARVGLGRQRFGTYAEERLGRSAIERMLTKHHTDAVREGKLTDEAAAAQKVSENGYALVIQTLRRCGLDEHTVPSDKATDNNQVLNEIRDEQVLNAEIDEMAKTAAAKVTERDDAMSQLEEAVVLLFTGMPERYIKRHRERAIKWADAVQETTMIETLRLIANEGLPVAVRVLDAMIKRVGQDFPNQLRGEKSIVLDANSQWSIGHRLIADANSRKRKTSDESFTALLMTLFADRAGVQIEKDLRDIVAGLLEDMATNFLLPLRKEVNNARETARYEQTHEQFRNLAGQSVPTALRPAENELLLQDVDTYPNTYDTLLTETSQSVEGAVADVICARFGTTRDFVRAPEELRPFDLKKWIPALVTVDGDGSQASAVVHLRFSLDHLLKRSAYWLRCDVQTPVGRFMNTTLHEHLNDRTVTDAERSKRVDGFVKMFDLAFDRAKPLTSISSTWVSNKFGLNEQDLSSFTFSRVPLTDGDSGYAKTVDLLRKRLNRTDVTTQFASGGLTEIEIFSSLRPLAPSAFGSLTFPITKAWGESVGRNVKGDGKFWQHRRARPLAQHLALPNAVRLTLARGWTAGLLTNSVRWTDDDRCEITSDGESLGFVQPPLSGIPSDAADRLAAVLSGALLAEMLAATGTTEPMHALEALLRLGTSDGTTAATASYDKPSPALIQAAKEAPNDAGPARWETDLRSTIAVVQTEFASFKPSITYKPLPPGIATAELQIRAITQVADALHRMVQNSVPPTTLGR